MARHQRMPTEEAGYTYAVVPCQSSAGCLQAEEDSIYGHSQRLELTPVKIIRRTAHKSNLQAQRAI
jgi:hypothetical protein